MCIRFTLIFDVEFQINEAETEVCLTHRTLCHVEHFSDLNLNGWRN
jgi:hypothetical protein